jgi:hypothetical protein
VWTTTLWNDLKDCRPFSWWRKLHIWTEIRNLRDGSEHIPGSSTIRFIRGMRPWLGPWWLRTANTKDRYYKLLVFSVVMVASMCSHCCSWHNKREGPIEDSLLCLLEAGWHDNGNLDQHLLLWLGSHRRGCLVIEKDVTPKKVTDQDQKDCPFRPHEKGSDH